MGSGARGVGIDIDQASIEHGRQLAAKRGLTDRVTLICGDGSDQAPEWAEAVVCIGASQVWGPPVEENQPLDYSSALAAIRMTVPRAVHEANIDEWDQFESGYGTRYAKWLAEHVPDHPDAAEIRARAAGQRSSYFGGYRGIMGMAYLALLAV